MTDPTELRRLAEAATSGPWERGQMTKATPRPPTTSVWGPPPKGEQGDSWIAKDVLPANAAYIAAMHPKTTLALLDRLARAEMLVAQCKATLEAMHPATGMPDDDVARLYNAMMEALGDEQ